MTDHQTKFIIDFDSTFTKVEALDELANIVLNGNNNKSNIEASIIEITRQAMEGELSFDKALSQRLELLSIHQSDIDQLIEVLKTKVSDSFIEKKTFIRNHADHIYIVSGGFKEFILPIVLTFGIHEDHVFANDFIFDAEGNVKGYNTKNPLSLPKGKVKLIESLHLQGDIVVIGDGYTDFEIREAGFASKFYLFVENVKREHLYPKADKIIESLNEILVN